MNRFVGRVGNKLSGWNGNRCKYLAQSRYSVTLWIKKWMNHKMAESGMAVLQVVLFILFWGLSIFYHVYI